MECSAKAKSITWPVFCLSNYFWCVIELNSLCKNYFWYVKVFSKIFNLALSICTIPEYLISATIVPAPKKTSNTSLYHFKPLALTPIVMKCFERLVLRHIKSALLPTLDQHQFAYRANRSVEDAINTALHTTLSNLEQPGTYVRMLFLDFSSAFNMFIPRRMETKLLNLCVNQHTCSWIKDFLTNQLQTVHSFSLTFITGAPQGCV